MKDDTNKGEVQLSAEAKAICREHFGHNKGGKLVGNRCGACPIAAPCRTLSERSPHSFDELYAHRDEFNTAVSEIAKEAT